MIDMDPGRIVQDITIEIPFVFILPYAFLAFGVFFGWLGRLDVLAMRFAESHAL